MNTLPFTVCDSLLLQYVDDTTIICARPSPEAAADLMNQQLSSIHDWSVQHRILLSMMLLYESQRNKNIWVLKLTVVGSSGL